LQISGRILKKFTQLCERKVVQADIIVRNSLKCRKKEYFVDAESDIKFENKEEETQKRISMN
jgi:hypothetical protein